jgi:hypothetical protein
MKTQFPLLVGFGLICWIVGCRWSPPTSENEGFDIRANDTAETAQFILLGEPIQGTIGNLCDTCASRHDVDWYHFLAGPGEVIEVSLSALPGSIYQPCFEVFEVTKRGATLLRAADPSPNRYCTTRQFSVPQIEGGRLFLKVRDCRESAGGQNVTYRLQVRRVD